MSKTSEALHLVESICALREKPLTTLYDPANRTIHFATKVKRGDVFFIPVCRFQISADGGIVGAISQTWFRSTSKVCSMCMGHLLAGDLDLDA